MKITKPKPQPKFHQKAHGLFYGMGSQRITPKNPYGLSWKLPDVSNDFVKNYEMHGATICLRHRPFGETLGGPMDFDQAVTIKNDENWSWLIDLYHKETSLLESTCPGAIIIDYLGTIEDQLEERRITGRYSQLLHRLQASVQPLMNHRVWIGYDAATSNKFPDGSIYQLMLDTIAACKREQGNDVVVESLPPIAPVGGKIDPEWAGSDWARDQHALCLERFYQSRIANHPDTYRFTSDTKSTIRVANGHSKEAWDAMAEGGIDPMQDYAESCFENGHTPVFAMQGYSYAEFVAKWNSL